MICCMVPELRSHFEYLEPYDVVDELKAVFMEQVRLMKFKCLNVFLSTKME